MQSLRIMLFYDGSFFRQGNIYFRYQERRGWFDLAGLHHFIERYVAYCANDTSNVSKIVAAHFYDGRATTRVAKPETLIKERDFELSLMKAGIVPHYQPVIEKSRRGADGDEISISLSQKGVDVQFAIDVLDAAHMDRFDVAVLITGDADFVPLVRRVSSLGRHVMIAHFTIDDWVDDYAKPHRGTRASRELLDAATFTLDFNRVGEDPKWAPVFSRAFFQPASQSNPTPPLMRSPVD